MKRQLGPLVAALMLLCASVAWAQSDSGDSSSSSSSSSSGSTGTSVSTPSTGNGASTDPFTANDPFNQNGSSSDSSQSGSTDDSQSSSSGPLQRFTHPEVLPALNSISEAANHTGLGLGFSVGSLSDYNWHPGGAEGNYWQNIGLFNGTLGLQQVRPTALWQLSYSGGVTTSSLNLPGQSTYATLNQVGKANILWEFAKRWQLHVKEQYIYTDNPFEPYLTYVSDPTPNYPDPIVYYPQAVVEQNQASADLVYRLTAHDSIIFNGYEAFNRWERTVQAAGLWNNFTYSGGGFYQHAFSARLTAGAGYSFAAIDFGHGESRAGVQTFQTFVAYKFNSHFTLSGWVGPELTNTKNIVVIGCLFNGCFYQTLHQQSWNTAAGATASYVRGTNVVRMQFLNSVTNGGGILGVTSTYLGTVAYSRPLARQWGFAFAATYNNSKSIAQGIRNEQYWTATEGTASLSRHFTDAWSGTAYLLFINQTQNFYGIPGTTSTMGLGIQLHYQWGHELGW